MLAGVIHGEAQVATALVEIKRARLENGLFLPSVKIGEVDEVAAEPGEIAMIMNSLLLIQGKTNKPITQAIPGDIIAVAKVEDLHIGDTVALNTNAPKLAAPSYPLPMFGLAVEPKARGDEQKISGSLHKIADEDPTFKMT
ncbi:MAG: hypothetical protein ACLQQ0_11780, partial [Limisphaerales bacterium]